MSIEYIHQLRANAAANIGDYWKAAPIVRGGDSGRHWPARRAHGFVEDRCNFRVSTHEIPKVATMDFIERCAAASDTTRQPGPCAERENRAHADQRPN